jgi:hypothetical protein
LGSMANRSPAPAVTAGTDDLYTIEPKYLAG